MCRLIPLQSSLCLFSHVERWLPISNPASLRLWRLLYRGVKIRRLSFSSCGLETGVSSSYNYSSTVGERATPGARPVSQIGGNLLEQAPAPPVCQGDTRDIYPRPLQKLQSIFKHGKGEKQEKGGSGERRCYRSVRANRACWYEILSWHGVLTRFKTSMHLLTDLVWHTYIIVCNIQDGVGDIHMTVQGNKLMLLHHILCLRIFYVESN